MQFSGCLLFCKAEYKVTKRENMPGWEIGGRGELEKVPCLIESEGWEGPSFYHCSI